MMVGLIGKRVSHRTQVRLMRAGYKDINITDTKTKQEMT